MEFVSRYIALRPVAVGLVAAAGLVALGGAPRDPGVVKGATIRQWVSSAKLRPETEVYEHGGALDLSSEVSVAARHGAGYHRSLCQWIPAASLVRVESAIATQRWRMPALARRLDDRMLAFFDEIVQNDPLALWAVNEQLMVRARMAKGGARQADLSEIRAWEDGFDRLRSRPPLPAWAGGRMADYLHGAALCETFLFVGLAVRWHQLQQAKVRPEQTLMWRRRWAELGRQVAAIDPAVFAGGDAVGEGAYRQLVNIARMNGRKVGT
jgi:hypothetical protein